MEMRWRNRLAVCFLILAVGIFMVPVYGADIVVIEQAKVNMPKIRLYVHDTENKMLSKDDVEAYLGQELLETEKVSRFDKDREGSRYVFLMDISSSVPSGTFEQIKKELKSFQRKMGKGDRWTLMTFGEKVTTVFQDQKASDQVSDKIDRLKGKDDRTLLFEALKQAAQDIDADSGQRNIFIVLTDGEDFSGGEASKAEALDVLEKKSVSLYAQGIENGDAKNRANRKALGEFARETGGEYRDFPSLEDLKDYLDEFQIVELAGSSNKITFQKETLSVNFKQEKKQVQKEVYLTRYQKAGEKAKISKAEKTGDKEIRIYYNQSMTGADEPDHFRILYQGKHPAEVLKAKYAEKDGDYYSTLQMKDSIYQGEYTIDCSDVVSDSMEKTEPEELTVRLKGKNYVVHHYGPIFLLAAVLTGGGVFAVFRTRKKKREEPETAEEKPREPENLEAVQEETTKPGGNKVAVREHLEAGHHPEIMLKVYADDRIAARISAEIDSSLMVGRNQNSDLYFDDPTMSRQQFVLFEKGEEIWIRNLSKTNPTQCNGRIIEGEIPLRNGDVLCAGSTIIKCEMKERTV